MTDAQIDTCKEHKHDRVINININVNISFNTINSSLIIILTDSEIVECAVLK